MDVLPMTISTSALARDTRRLANAGLAIMSAAFVWWFLFYAQWSGPLHLLDLKVPCLVAKADACSFFQSRLHEYNAAGPAYHPAAWWIGMTAFLAGRVTGMLLPGKPQPVVPRLAGKAPGLGLRRDRQKDGALRD